MKRNCKICHTPNASDLCLPSERAATKRAERYMQTAKAKAKAKRADKIEREQIKRAEKIERELIRLRDTTVSDFECFDLSELDTVAQDFLASFQSILRQNRVKNSCDLQDLFFNCHI